MREPTRAPSFFPCDLVDLVAFSLGGLSRLTFAPVPTQLVREGKGDHGVLDRVGSYWRVRLCRQAWVVGRGDTGKQ